MSRNKVKPTIRVASDAFAHARRIGRVSRHPYITWTRPDGQHCYARLSHATIKQAMCDVGVHGRIYWCHRHTVALNWRSAVQQWNASRPEAVRG